jgi:hypothetical protein
LNKIRKFSTEEPLGDSKDRIDNKERNFILTKSTPNLTTLNTVSLEELTEFQVQPSKLKTRLLP